MERTEHNKEQGGTKKKIFSMFSFLKKNRSTGMQPRGVRVEKLWKLFLLVFLVVNCIGLTFHVLIFLRLRSESLFVSDVVEDTEKEVVSKEELEYLLRRFEEDRLRHEVLKESAPVVSPLPPPPPATTSEEIIPPLQTL